MMNVIIDWKNLRRLYDEINCRCKLNIFQGARVKSLCQMFAASFYGITENKKSANEHLTQTPKNSLWKPLRNYGKIVSNRVVAITYEGESLLWLLR